MTGSHNPLAVKNLTEYLPSPELAELICQTLNGKINAYVKIGSLVDLLFFCKCIAPILETHPDIRIIDCGHFLANPVLRSQDRQATALQIIIDILEKNPRITTIMLNGIYLYPRSIALMTESLQNTQIKKISMQHCTFENDKALALLLKTIYETADFSQLNLTASCTKDPKQWYPALGKWYPLMSEKLVFDFVLEDFVNFIDLDSFELEQKLPETKASDLFTIHHDKVKQCLASPKLFDKAKSSTTNPNKELEEQLAIIESELPSLRNRYASFSGSTKPEVHSVIHEKKKQLR